jgi:hypothetical protein
LRVVSLTPRDRLGVNLPTPAMLPIPLGMRRVMAVWIWLVCTAPFVATRVHGQAEPQSSCSALVPEAPGASATEWRAWGASVVIIDSAAIASLAGRTLSEVLTARLPGVSVMRRTTPLQWRL